MDGWMVWSWLYTFTLTIRLRLMNQPTIPRPLFGPGTGVGYIYIDGSVAVGEEGYIAK